MNSDTSQVDLNTLQWVKSEIDDTLKLARQELEAYVEGPADDSHLQLVVNYLHQVRGTLQIVELYGAAMLSEELEILSQALADGSIEGRDDIYEIMMRAMWQLPDYLERLQAGHKDIPMVLLPLLNDLRAARNAPLLSESALFTPDLDVKVPAVVDPDTSEDLPRLAKKLRHIYHLGLLDWYRERDSEGGLEKLDSVIEKLRNAANDQEVNRVLWSASGVVEALREGGLEPSVAVKLLMGKLDREIKKIIDQGESVLSKERPEELEKNLLYYVASSSSEGEKVNALKKTFNLAEALPDEATLERARADLTGPNAELLQTVSKVLLDNLLHVKDQLDVFMRGDERNPASLKPLCDSLGQTADTLGMLGFGKQRQIVVEQAELLNQFASGAQELDEAILMDVAHELLALESLLQGAKAGKADISSGDDVDHEEMTREAAQQELTSSVMDEARKNMGQVKDAMGAFIEAPRNMGLISDVPNLLDQIRGSFEILSLQRAAGLVETSRIFVQQEMIDARRSPDPASMDALADAISSIEYYMDSVAGQWGNPNAILQVAEQRLAQIGLGDHIEALNRGVADTQSELADESTTDSVNEAGSEETGVPDDDDTMIDLAPEELSDSSSATIQLDEELGMNIELTDMSTADIAMSELASQLEARGLVQDDKSGDTEEIDISDLVNADYEEPVLEQDAMEQVAVVPDDEAVTAEIDLADLDISDLDVSEQIILEGDVQGEAKTEETEIDLSELSSHSIEFNADEAIPGEGMGEGMDEPTAEIDLSDLSSGVIEYESGEIKLDGGIQEEPEPGKDLDETAEIEPPDLDSSHAISLNSAQLDKLEQETTDSSLQISAPDDLLLEEHLDDTIGDTSTTTQEIEFDASQLDLPDEIELTGLDEQLHAAAIEESDHQIPSIETESSENEINDINLVQNQIEPAEENTSNDTQEIEFDSSIIEVIDNDKLTATPAEVSGTSLSVEDLPELKDRMQAWYADTNNDVLTRKLRRTITDIKKQARQMGRDEVAKVASDMAALCKSVNKGEIPLTEEIKNSLHFALDTLADVLPAKPEQMTGNVVPLKPDPVTESTPAPVPVSVSAPAPPTPPSSYEVSEEIDDEIIEIFLEEAEEEFHNINERLTAWRANPQDEEGLRELRRSFHTLKGSGRLVGATEVGEFAWAFENMLNRVIDNTIKAEPAVFDILEQARQTLPQLFELFKTAGKAGPDVFRLMEQAEAYSHGNLPASTTDDARIEVIADEPQEATSAVDHIAVDEQATVVENREPEQDQNLAPSIDATLLDIFRKETANHLTALQEYLDEWNNGHDRTANHKLVRALHTLKGSSRTAGVPGLAELCHRFEKLANEMSNHHIEVSDSMLQLLDDSMQFVEDTVSLLDQPGTPLPDNAHLMTQLADEELVITEMLSSASIKQAADDHGTDQQAEPEQIIEPAPAPVSEYDEELLQIFIEEGEEILDESDQTLHKWASDRPNGEYIEALQRQLHTLKGGARMAGVQSIGDLSHVVESLLTAMVEGQLQADEEIYQVLQSAQDKLVQQLEQLKAREAMTQDSALLHRIEQLLGNEPVAEDVIEPVITPVDTSDGVSEQISDEQIIDLSDVSLHEISLDDLNREAAEASPESSIQEVSLTDETIPEIAIPEEINPEDILAAPELDDASVENEEPAAALVPQQDALADEATELPDNVEPITKLQPLRKKAPAPAAAQDNLPEQTTAREQIRVKSDLLDNLVNFAGEVSIYRSRMEQQTNAFRYNLQELDDTVSRLRDQLRKFEMEAEAQIQYRAEESLSPTQEEFDPLEFDRFTQMQQLSRGMLESLNDLDSLRSILGNLTRESETLLVQQSRVNTELQEGLMRTRMVPFSTSAARLRRIVRQTAEELGKHAELHLHGADSELDRTVLDRILPALEHMLRNAIAHGIEEPAQRSKRGKSETGQINLSLSREGADIIMRLSDDGAGIDLEAIQRKAIEKGKLKPGSNVTKETLLELIMESGFSTAEKITQISGRGVGMDVVNSEIKQLGGLLNIDTEQNQGTTFTVSLPLTLSVTRALMVQVGDETYAIPLLSIEGVERVNAEKLQELYDTDNPVYKWIGQDYPFIHLGSNMGLTNPSIPKDRDKIPLLMVHSGEYRAAVQVDNLIGSREVVVKPVGAQLSTMRGISGATIMGDGSVVLIIDLGVLIRRAAQQAELAEEIEVPIIPEVEEQREPMVMVVDDSITVRKVTTRLLERHHYRAISAKDGVDALAQLQEVRPDVILLDVEMPRMDGFELATNIRNDDNLRDIPIIMITSRTGQKHRDRASHIGVNFYLGKPYNEAELLENIQLLISIPA